MEQLDNHKKKMTAPIVVTILIICYYGVYLGILITLFDGIWKYALGIIPLIFSAAMLKVCIERIKEIQEDEEDEIKEYFNCS